MWLHIITPIQTAALIAVYGLLTQGYGIAKLRRELSWQSIWPLTFDPTWVRVGVGVLLALYATDSLARPPLGPFKIGVPGDIAIGISNGLIGGLSGLGRVISTISCQFRGWSRDKQRAVFQPVLVAAFVIISISQFAAGSYTTETVKLYGIGLPFMVAGIWIGFKLNDETVRKDSLDIGARCRRVADRLGIGPDASHGSRVTVIVSNRVTLSALVHSATAPGSVKVPRLPRTRPLRHRSQISRRCFISGVADTLKLLP